MWVQPRSCRLDGCELLLALALLVCGEDSSSKRTLVLWFCSCVWRAQAWGITRGFLQGAVVFFNW